MSIYIPGTGFATQGPCPDGFHVPLINEWQGLNTIIQGLSLSETGGNKVRVNLHMPLAGQRTINTGGTGDQYEFGYYWSSSENNNGESTYSYRYYFNFHSNYIVDDSSSSEGYGYSIRPFKNSFVAPTSGRTVINGTLGGAGIFWNQTDGIISITSDGSTGYTIADKNLGATVVYNNGDALSQSNCGYYYQRGNNYGFAWTGSITISSAKVDASGYGPGNYYESSTFITSSSTPYGWDSSHNQNLRGGVDGNVSVSQEVQNIYIGEYKGYTPGIYHNSTDGLISFSSDGTTWYTIADKNLGASTVYNNGDTLSASNCGYYYQWGNNYGFHWTGSISSSSTQVNASNYGPTNPYSSSTFIYYSSGRNWDSSNNMNLWGDITDTLEARKGPCDTGFHVPTDSDLTILCDTLTTISGEQIGDALKKYALMPMNGYRNGNTSSGEIGDRNVFGWYWTSSTGNFSYGSYPYRMYFYSSSKSISDNPTSAGFNVRPFKNEPVIPNSSWTVLYQ